MDEYIKKSDMFALLCEDCEDDCESENVYCDYKRFKNIPAADVAPVMHGEWRENGLNGYAYAFICSKCGYIDGYPFNDRFRYCPNCGAKMDGGDGNG